MIYLSDDYIEKYSNTLSYLIGRSANEGYSFDYIQRKISYSEAISEFEKSNVTIIAFSSMEKIYSGIFTDYNNEYQYNPYDIFGWVGYAYIHLFLNLEITFEALFFLIPLQEMLNMYKLYHEMDITHLEEYAKEVMKYSLLDVIMKRKKTSNNDLSKKTNIPVSTINSLRYGNRDITKLEAKKILSIAYALNVKIETLLTNIDLVKQG